MEAVNVSRTAVRSGESLVSVLTTCKPSNLYDSIFEVDMIFQRISPYCINLAILTLDRIAVVRGVLKQFFLLGGVSPLGSKQEDVVLDIAVGDALPVKRVESAESTPRHLSANVVGHFG